MTTPPLDDLLQPNTSLRQAKPDIVSVLPSDVERASYDARAAAYDRVVGSEPYNRLLWGVSTARYRAFVDRALAAGSGSLLDPGSGSAVFTAKAYVHAARPVLLIDRSLGMLEAARERLEEIVGGPLPNHVTLLQADVTNLPLQPESVETILSMGMLHLFDDAVGHVEQLLRLLVPGGTLFATSLVAERTIGQQYLRLLHWTDEVATPRTYAELRQRLTSRLNHEIETDRKGSMAFFTVQNA